MIRCKCKYVVLQFAYGFSLLPKNLRRSGCASIPKLCGMTHRGSLSFHKQHWIYFTSICFNTSLFPWIPISTQILRKNSQNPERKFTTTTTIQKSINQNQILLLLFKNGWFWIYIVVMSFSFTLFCRHTLLRNCVYIEFIRSQGRIEFAHIRTHRESLCGARLPAGTSAVSVREFECANHGMENSSKLVYIYAGTIFSGEIKSENGISIIVNNKMGSKTSHFNHCCHAISSGWRATCVRVCVCVA